MKLVYNDQISIATPQILSYSNEHKSITAFALTPSAHSSKVRDGITIDGRYGNADESISLLPIEIISSKVLGLKVVGEEVGLI